MSEFIQPTASSNNVNQLIHCYDEVAETYANKFLQELDNKPLDQLLLKDFAQKFSNSSANQRVIDFGCGPGQTTKFLYDNGVCNIVGTDISPAMIEQANRHHLPSTTTPLLDRQLSFEVANMLQLPYTDHSYDGAIAFYSIVNFNYEQITIAFKEIVRVLKPNGLFMFSFHIGDAVVTLNEFLEKEVEITFFFLDVDRIHELLRAAGLEVIQTVIRYPYVDIEHQSKRAYITAKKL